MVTGKPGVGKSAIFKALFSLWPVYDGVVSGPKAIFYVPKRSFLVSGGSLKEQVTYPKTAGDYDDLVVLKALALASFDAVPADLQQQYET